MNDSEKFEAAARSKKWFKKVPKGGTDGFELVPYLVRLVLVGITHDHKVGLRSSNQVCGLAKGESLSGQETHNNCNAGVPRPAIHCP